MAKPTFAVVFNPCHLNTVGPQMRELFASESAALARADKLRITPTALAPAVRVGGMPVTNVANLWVERIDTIRTYTATFV